MAEPRVNSVSLLSHQGRAVTLLGTVAEISGAQLVVTASDRKPVNVDVSAASVHHAGLAVGSLVDVVGTVQHGKLVAVRDVLRSRPFFAHCASAERSRHCHRLSRAHGWCSAVH